MAALPPQMLPVLYQGSELDLGEDPGKIRAGSGNGPTPDWGGSDQGLMWG